MNKGQYWILSKYYEDDVSNSKYNYDFLEQLENALPSYKQKAIEIYGEYLKDLNRPNNSNDDDDDDEDNDIPKPVFKQIRLSDFMKTRQISSDKEIEEYVKELEEKLKEELRKVDYFILS